MELCAGCGIIAPTESTSCSSCKAVFPAPRLEAIEREDDNYWVAVRCELRCEKCYGRTPRNHLDASGVATCGKCGKTGSFVIEDWVPVFDHAHSVGDLTGPDPSGRPDLSSEILGERNPFKSVGVDVSSASFGEQSGPTFVIASPGQPFCPRCHVPLEMPLEGELRATTKCPSCNEEGMYELANDAKQVYPALQMVLAEGNRVDRSNSDAETQTQTWWLLFSGVSPQRAAIEKLIRFDAESAEEKAGPSSSKRATQAKANTERYRAIWLVAAVIAGAVAYKIFVKEESKPASETSEPAEPAPAHTSGSGHATHGSSH